MFNLGLGDAIAPIVGVLGALFGAAAMFFTGKSAGKTEAKINSLEKAGAIKAKEDEAVRNAPTTTDGVADEFNEGKF